MKLLNGGIVDKINQGVTISRNPLIFKSGQKDSNLRPPAPKAGALAGLRHTPKKKTILHRLLSSRRRGDSNPRYPLLDTTV